jgi:hypothetical protein
LTLKQVGQRWIVWWERNEEGGWAWTEGEGVIDELVGIREELLRGDYRALFLGWLADFSPDEWTNPKDRAVLLPPIPGGLDRLSPAQAALIKHFPVDRDALAVAASLSQASTPERIPIATVVERLPVSEMRALLERVAAGEGPAVMAELNRLAAPPPPAAGVATLSCVDFAAKVRAVRDARLKEEAEAASAKRNREAEARRQRLASAGSSAHRLLSRSYRHIAPAEFDRAPTGALEQATGRCPAGGLPFDSALLNVRSTVCGISPLSSRRPRRSPKLDLHMAQRILGLRCLVIESAPILQET